MAGGSRQEADEQTDRDGQPTDGEDDHGDQSEGLRLVARRVAASADGLPERFERFSRRQPASSGWPMRRALGKSLSNLAETAVTG